LPRASEWYGFQSLHWLRRHPFSGPPASAGELLHTPQRIPTFMATALLSIASDTLCGFWVSQYSGTLTILSDHPASPVLLTSIGPHRAVSFRLMIMPCVLHSQAADQSSKGAVRASSQFADGLRRFSSPGPRDVALPRTTIDIHKQIYVFDSSDPEGNFEGNQQRGGSMSLSPLCLALTNELHVNTETGVHHGFPWLHRCMA